MKKLFAVKDAKVGFISVFQAENKFIALRVFGEEANNANSPINKFSKDFALYSVGTFDEDTGSIVPEVEFIEEAENMKKKQEVA